MDAEQAHPLPATVSFAAGAAINVAYSTAYRALHQRSAVKPGMRVLVHGASGGVGIAAVQLAAAHGCVVTGTASSAAGRALVLAAGASHALDHSVGGFAYLAGKKFDVIVEMLADKNVGADVRHLDRGGTVAIVGNRGAFSGAEIDFRQIMNTESRILGVLGERTRSCIAKVLPKRCPMHV